METMPRHASPAECNFNDPAHGRMELPSLTVNGYSLELHEPGDPGAFIGDRVSRSAFTAMVDAWRTVYRRMGDDPLGKRSTADMGKKRLDVLLKTKEEAASLIEAAVQDYALQFADVAGRFLRQPSWKAVERIVVGGGFQQSRVGRRAVKRAAALLKDAGVKVDLRTLHHHADEGGLIGWLHLVPPDLLHTHDAMLAVDIGGTNLRCGIVRSRQRKASDLSKADVLGLTKWGHADDADATGREDLVQGLARRLSRLVAHARDEGISLAPCIGVACPGLICQDGSIAAGAQNLPGNWESTRFHFPSRLAQCIPTINGAATLVLLHNDAVVQGLSERPFTQDVKRWAVMTVGTGLGNASYRNR